MLTRLVVFISFVCCVVVGFGLEDMKEEKYGE